jgi:uncharacterized protein YidB (DUF937 family)
MGLMDILNGMQNGPRGQQQAGPASSGGMSPMMMALLGLLAYKAVKGGGLGNMLGGSSPSADPRAAAPASSGSGLGDILGGLMGNTQAMPGGLGGMLGGLLGGAAGGGAGGALNNGLRSLLGDMEENGQGDAARSWVSNGPNQSLSPNDLAHAIGADDIDAVSRQTGMPRDQLLSALSQHLPDLVNQLTPNGRLPTEHEAARW